MSLLSNPSATACPVGYVDPVSFVTKSTIKWDIHNFSNYFTMKSGEYIRSRMFTSVGPNYTYQWELNLYPTGDSRVENQKYLSLFLKSLTEVNVIAEFTIKILDNNKIVHEFGPLKTIFNLPDRRSWGVSSFLEKMILMDKTNGMLTDNKLTIVCEIKKVFRCSNMQHIELWLKKPVNSFKLEVSDDIEKLLNNEKHSDVTFIVDGQSLRAHKCVLSSRSLVFAAMFDHDMIENTVNEVEVNDMDYDILNEMFRFIYSGKVNNIEAIAGDLLVAADKYALEGLKTMCEDSLCKCLSVENALEYLSIADLHNADKLKLRTKQFISIHAKEMVVKPEFQAIGNLHADLIVEVCHALCNLSKKTPENVNS